MKCLNESCDDCNEELNYCTECIGDKDQKKFLTDNTCKSECPITKRENQEFIGDGRYYGTCKSCEKLVKNCARCDETKCLMCVNHPENVENKPPAPRPLLEKDGKQICEIECPDGYVEIVTQDVNVASLKGEK